MRDSNDELLTLLRQAWRHAETTQRLIQQAQKQLGTADVLKGLLILASEQADRARTAVERAAKIMRRS